MQNVILDCSAISGPEQLHDAFAQALSFPQWYGRNLDALYDCLTSITGQTTICLLCWEHLGPWQRGFRCVLEDAAEANPCLQICWQS